MKVSNYSYEIKSRFGVKFYINFQNVLRAARLKKVDFYLNRNDYLCTYEVAGLGIVEEDFSGGYFHDYPRRFTLYESVDSFKKNEPFKPIESPEYKLSTFEILYAAFDGIADVFNYRNEVYVRRYEWNGVKAEEVDISGHIWLEEDGFHTDAKIPAGTYITKIKCEKDNQLSVIEFDDEK